MYKKGNYIAFMTKQPEVHLNVMFGYNDLTEADFEKTEHIGFILSVIDDKTYLVMTVRPWKGFVVLLTMQTSYIQSMEMNLRKKSWNVKK